MFVPTHNLYDFIYQVLENEFLLMYFFPFGEKDINNLIKFQSICVSKHNNRALNVYPDHLIDIARIHEFCPWLLCHDQEPLNFEYYQHNDADHWYTKNLRRSFPGSAQKKWILLHSELNSVEVEKYNNSNLFECAYWWSHAVISLDWFRFAKFDQFLQPATKIEKLFLVYARDTTGTRNYRKKFLEYIQNIDQCQVGSFIQEIDSPTLSATYNVNDINSSAFSIVLETIFDSRIHLTEKTLKPIATGHPFLIANGSGTLEYLRTYGFKTFSPWINESYDLEPDNNKRLKMIAKEMHRLENLPKEELDTIIMQCLKIAEYNKSIFFSESFFNQVVQELKTNVKKCKINDIDWKYIWSRLKLTSGKSATYSTRKRQARICLISLIKHLKKGGTLEDHVPPNLD